MPRIQIHSSAYGTPGEVVAVEYGQVVWTGPIDALAEAGSCDAIFCHDDDEARLCSLTESRAAPVAAISADGAKAKA